MKVYLIEGSAGQYEDSYSWIEKGFLNKDKAIDYLNNRNNFFENLESYKDTWYEINDRLDEAIPDEYWDSINNVSEEESEIPEIWNDSVNNFIVEMKNTLPEKYEELGDELLNDLFNYYHGGSYYDGMPYFTIVETEIEE